MLLSECRITDLVPPTSEVTFERDEDGRLRVYRMSDLIREHSERAATDALPEFPQNMAQIRATIRFPRTTLVFEPPLPRSLTAGALAPIRHEASQGTVRVVLPVAESFVDDLSADGKLELMTEPGRTFYDMMDGTARDVYMQHYRLWVKLKSLWLKHDVEIDKRKLAYLDHFEKV